MKPNYSIYFINRDEETLSEIFKDVNKKSGKVRFFKIRTNANDLDAIIKKCLEQIGKNARYIFIPNEVNVKKEVASIISDAINNDSSEKLYLENGADKITHRLRIYSSDKENVEGFCIKVDEFPREECKYIISEKSKTLYEQYKEFLRTSNRKKAL